MGVLVASWAVGVLCVGSGYFKGSVYQRLLVEFERCPVRIVVAGAGTCSVVTARVSLVNMAVQLASQSWPMESRLVDVRAGKRWVSVAAGGSGIGIFAVWVEFMDWPLATWTEIAGV